MMPDRTLSQSIEALREQLARFEARGLTFEPEAVRVIVRALASLRRSAEALEAAGRERDLPAVAADPDVLPAPRLSAMRRAVARVATPVPQTNVILFPLQRRPAPGTGDAA
ncbi:hypothetical protein DFO45_4861 [Azorhizobium sp. AG788]|uniref:hypothetical protein n=1 Tax=Azorhizobium sp. AG788 TaxID=2183897 RepID=UPI0010610A75|nr:hypothetical protein [Azorhizobium sp. AG788]TDT88072.1 hypothetical protein DFO45_4861 [Azorhizobium sp. AG788]